MSGTTAMGWLLHTLGGGGLLLLLAWIWAAWTRQPARRLRIVEWAAAASLLLALLSLGPAWLVVAAPPPAAAPPAVASQAPLQRPEAAAEAPAKSSTTPASAGPLVLPATIPPEIGRAAPPGNVPAPAPAAPEPKGERAAEGPAPSSAAAPAQQRSWKWDPNTVASAVAAVYLVMGVAVLGRWLVAWVALRRLLARAESVGGRAAELLMAMCTEQRIGRGGKSPPRLLASRQVRAPFSCGVLRPTIVLPAGLCNGASDEALRWVLAHEFAHVERRDALWGLLLGLAQAIYFPVPWFWRLRRQARLCQEYLADAAAAAAGGRPEDYAQFLLNWTAAPRPPVGACGVWGYSSDLFWRIKTMLQSSAPLERRCPRRWSLAAAGGLLSLAVLAAGVTWKATAAPAPNPVEEPKKEEPKKDEPKKDDPKVEQPKAQDPAPDLPGFPNLEDLLKNNPNLPPEVIQQYRANMQMMREQMRRARELQRQGFGANQPFPLNPLFPGLQPQEARLGAAVEKPSDTLVEQLDLPKDQGMIVRDVTPDSAAAKAGLKAHDILLEMDGKPVPSDADGFRKALEGVKADTPVDVVVLRKGKKETVKGLSLPEAKAAAPGFPGFNPIAPPLIPQPIIPALPPLIPGNALDLPIGAGNGVITTTFRTNDHFTTRHQEGSLIITLTGKVADGKATVSEISVQDGAESNKYESVEKVPEKYRDKVQNLVEMSEKGTVKVEIKGP